MILLSLESPLLQWNRLGAVSHLPAPVPSRYATGRVQPSERRGRQTTVGCGFIARTNGGSTPCGWTSPPATRTPGLPTAACLPCRAYPPRAGSCTQDCQSLRIRWLSTTSHPTSGRFAPKCLGPSTSTAAALRPKQSRRHLGPCQGAQQGLRPREPGEHEET